MSEIDVSKCAFYYSNGKCNIPNGTACNCNNIVNCYYKQLQQLKQLCEQKSLDNYDLTEENEELKQQIKAYAKVNEEDAKEWLKCKYALYEIEEICKRRPYWCNSHGKSCDTCNCEQKNILQKIKEVKGNANI